MHFQLTTLATVAALVPLSFAAPSPIQARHNNKATPSLPFTVAAFQSPYPDASNGHVTGLKLRAFAGSLWISPDNALPQTGCGSLKGKKCPPGNETVLWVDSDGKAWLNSADPQAVYLNTATGVLSYLAAGKDEFPAGAVGDGFRHLGSNPGGAVTVPSSFDPNFVNAGPSTFTWLGSDNAYWFLCPRPGPGYQVMKYVGGTEHWDSCTVVALVALDYTGASPAAGEYL